MLIKEMAERTGLTDATLRYYERIGLMPPVPRKRGGVRQYKDSHVQYVSVIQCLKASGMSLDDIQAYMKLARQGEKTTIARKELLAASRQQLLAKIAAMQAAVAEATFQLRHYDMSLGVTSACIAHTAWQQPSMKS